MDNKTWQKLGETFADPKSGYRFKVEITHGAMARTFGKENKFLPTTRANIRILPKEDEIVDAFAAKLRMRNIYKEVVDEHGEQTAEDMARTDGLGIVHANSQFAPGGALEEHNFDGTPYNAIGSISRLRDKMDESKIALAEETYEAMQDYLERNISKAGRENAEKWSRNNAALQRMVSKSTIKPAR